MARQTVRFIGDVFLRDNFGAFGAIRREAIISKRSQPFTYKYFEVSAFYQAFESGVLSCLTRILNTLIEAFNRNSGIPDYVIFVPDIDILKNVNFYDYGISWILSICLHWLARQIEKKVNSRKEHLQKIKPGALPKKEVLLQ